MNGKRLAFILAFALAACGGGGGSGSTGSNLPPAGGSGTAAATQRVAVSLIVPSSSSSSSSGIKHRAYISASALGATITVTQGPATVTTTLDLSPTSTSCTGSGSSRTCTVNVTVPVGTDTFTITIYNEAPVGGTIPSGAQILGVGVSVVNVIAGSTTNIPVVVGGQIASFGATLPSGSVPANGMQQTVGIVIAPTDFGDNAIASGASPAPYANPITVAVSESGGSGHASVSLNGGTPQSSVVLKQSTDAVSVVYDGGGSPGYSFTISLSASGVSTQSATISPLIAAIGGTGVTSLALYGSVSNLSLAIGEAGTSNTYTPALTGACTGITTIGAISGSGETATLPVQGGATASAAGCSLNITDNLHTTLALPISNTLAGTTTTVNGTMITEYSGYVNPYGITVGSDGNIWFTDQGETPNFYGLNPAGGPAAGSPVTLQYPYNVAAGSDGALWITDQDVEGLDRVTIDGGTAEVATFPELDGGVPYGIVGGSDGTLWFGDQEFGLYNVNVGGGLNQILPGSITSAYELAQASDGSIWFTIEDSNTIEQYVPSTGVVNTVTIPDGGQGNYIAAGPDNAIWFTAFTDGGGIVGRIDLSTGAPYTATAIVPSANAPQGIVGGADNAVWYVDSGNNNINRISTSAGNTMTSYPVPTADAGPLQITLGPDGSLWFTENSAGNIGHIVP